MNLKRKKREAKKLKSPEKYHKRVNGVSNRASGQPTSVILKLIIHLICISVSCDHICIPVTFETEECTSYKFKKNKKVE